MVLCKDLRQRLEQLEVHPTPQRSREMGVVWLSKDMLEQYTVLKLHIYKCIFWLFFAVGIVCMTFKVCLVSSLGEQHVIDSCRLAPAVLAQATVGNVSEVNSLLHHVLDVSAILQKATQPNKATVVFSSISHCHKAADRPHKVANPTFHRLTATKKGGRKL